MAVFVERSEKKAVVHAEQYLPGKQIPGVRVCGELVFLDRLGGDVQVFPGDWIVVGTGGECYAIGDSIFRQLYQAA